MVEVVEEVLVDDEDGDVEMGGDASGSASASSLSESSGSSALEGYEEVDEELLEAAQELRRWVWVAGESCRGDQRGWAGSRRLNSICRALVGKGDLAFRSYKPRSTVLKKAQKQGGIDLDGVTIDKEVEKIKTELRTGAAEMAASGELLPKPVDWDLKRDAQPRLDRLQRETQRAIRDLVAQKIKEEEEQDVEMN